MPLPDLQGTAGGYFAADFRDIGAVATTDLARASRVAVLSNYGIHLLQQRHIYYMTRLTVDVETLAETFDGVSTEMELQYEWCENALDRSGDGDPGAIVEDAEATFQAFLSESDDRRRGRLKEALTRADVRREVRRHLAQQ